MVKVTVTKASTQLTGGKPSFITRKLKITLTLASGTFTGTTSSSTVLQGFRASARITKAGGPVQGMLDLQVWGMRQSVMDDLSTLGMRVNLLPRNTVTVEAGDDVDGYGTVFVGTTINCWGDYGQAPEVPFRVEGQTGAFGAALNSAALSTSGVTDVTTALSGIANVLGLRFENNGVSSKLPASYYFGSPRDQALAIVQDAGINWNGGDDGVLAIWPANGARGGAIPFISPTTGLIGYPTYTANGIEIRVIFNPSITLGAQIQVQSSLKAATKIWNVYAIDHSLDALLPGGLWESRIACLPPGIGPVLPPF